MRTLLPLEPCLSFFQLPDSASELKKDVYPTGDKDIYTRAGVRRQSLQRSFQEIRA